MHSHIGNGASPNLKGSSDTNSRKGLTLPWYVFVLTPYWLYLIEARFRTRSRLRSIDGIDTHDQAYKLTVSGGVSTSLVLPGSADAIGGQAFVIKLRDTKERSPLARVLEAPWSLLNGTNIDHSVKPRWRHMK